MSGGVDSALCAYLLSERGACVTGIYMRNWDSVDETGVCTSDADWADVRDVCRTLGIPCQRVDFVKEYWGSVFEGTLDAFQRGDTPNPDVMCNKEIKFGALYQRLFESEAKNEFDVMATGHYARRVPMGADQFQLGRARDRSKDQSYFLAAIDGSVLPRVVFPLGDAAKSDVKSLAREVGLAKYADKKESMGICFIGKRKRFGDFLDGYIEQAAGRFILEDGTVIGTHDGVAKYTIGQNAKLAGLTTKYFVARKDPPSSDLLVVPDRDHPLLYARSAVVEWVRWTHAENEQLALHPETSDGEPLRAQVRYRQAAIDVRLEKLNGMDQYLVHFAEPVRAITPGQILVLYKGDVCLGCGVQQHLAAASFN
ncbi:tRNA methyl transferase [Blastocladiella britannica]|nr:tRNA methyl transferase [Blastocladiella britannica]